eukprot:TRINITY_DN5181_c0_g1_i2.p1 TRINITY_DN5181_c0_g1~~TRINITY_DN5181_c0_g1_i2.p1  ORF type:complete len:662 (+),score=144.42 TRINITY_DN5181_c0_g1_i2:70-1986(+)
MASAADRRGGVTARSRTAPFASGQPPAAEQRAADAESARAVPTATAGAGAQRGAGRLRRAGCLLFAALLAGGPPVAMWSASADGSCLFFCEPEQWVENTTIEDCPPQLTYGYDSLDLPNGSVLHVFAQKRRSRLRVQGNVTSNASCVPHSNRHCGFSHAYFNRPLTEHKDPSRPIALPHHAGGVPATLVKWDVLEVHVGETSPHAAVRVISAVAAYSLIRKHKATVAHRNRTIRCSATLDKALLFPLSVHPQWQEKNLAHFIGDVWHWLFQLGREYPIRGSHPIPVIMFPVRTLAVASAYAARHGMPSLVRDVAPGLVASADVRPGTCFRQLYANCPAPSTLRPMADMHTFMSQKYGWSFTPRTCGTMGSCRANFTLAMRRAAGTRAVANPLEVLRMSAAVGFCAHTVRFEGMTLRQVADTLQHTDVLLAMHGAEHAAMSFMRVGSVVIEAVPQWYADEDAFYIAQANAGGLSLLRWRLSGSGLVVYHNGLGFGLPCKWLRTVGTWSIFQHRSLPSLVHLPPAEYAPVLEAARSLLPWTPPSSPCPQPIPAVADDQQCGDWWRRARTCNKNVTTMPVYGIPPPPQKGGHRPDRGSRGGGQGSRRYRELWAEMERKARSTPSGQKWKEYWAEQDKRRKR